MSVFRNKVSVGESTRFDPLRVGANVVVTLVVLVLTTTLKAQTLEPVAQWRFDGESSLGTWWGKTGTIADGPRPPKYPGFESSNTAMSFAGHKGAILIKDHERGGATNVRFGAGDTFAFETWVKFRSIHAGQIVYVLGKGRHPAHGEDFGDDNQNYSIRFQGTAGAAKFGLLFTSEHPETHKRAWHRWWSKSVLPSTGWHHVALEFTFGKSDSLRAWIDGKPVKGEWDESGPTDLPPVQDADDLVIGTGFTRGASSSFQGWLDNLAIYRGSLDPAEIAERYRFVPPPPAVTPEMIPHGKVLVQISEDGVPKSNNWPDEPIVTETYHEDVFGLFELPHKYVATGVRGDRSNPSHLRASAIVNLPAGKHRLLVRGRGRGRLFIDGKNLLETPPRPHDPGGYQPLSVQDEYLDLGPDFRFAPPGNRDAWCEFETDGGEHFIILETMVGGVTGRSTFRPELGETVVAVSLEGSKSWSLLSAGDHAVPYTDEGWQAYESERRKVLAKMNADSRAERRDAHHEYWDRRRNAAAEWLANTAPVTVPELPLGYPAHNAIDHFIAARIAKVKQDSVQGETGGVDYFKQIRPLLESRCYDCHRGGKAKGDLRLDDHASVLTGGDYDGPAIVPGHVDQSALIDRITSDDEDVIMPPKGEPLTDEEVSLLRRWIQEGAVWPQFDVDS
ncbi:Cytochrome C, Planctomycete domain protein, partial [Rhodopirellula maiorica SM1]